jgi:hypothetical protein
MSSSVISPGVLVFRVLQHTVIGHGATKGAGGVPRKHPLIFDLFTPAGLPAGDAGLLAAANGPKAKRINSNHRDDAKI